jgi:hypothetical protein
MSAVVGLREPEPWFFRLTRSERNAWLSVSILAGCFAGFAAVWAVEMDLGRWTRDLRLVRSVSETTARYVAIAHFLLAILFLATARRMRAARPWARVAAFALLAAGLCVAWDGLRGRDEYLARLLFFVYFIAHDWRDQVFCYEANGDAPPSIRAPGAREALFLAGFVPIAALAAALGAFNAAGLVGGSLGEGTLPPLLRGAFLFLPVPVLFAALRLRALLRQEGMGTLASLVRAHRPLARIYALNLGVLLVGLVFTGQMYTIVVLHVTGWYVFTWRQLRERPAEAPAPRPPGWRWMRSTPAGFTFLHAGLVALCLTGGVVWAYGFRNDPGLPAFAVVLGQAAFPLWTIGHVTVSFGSR